MAKDTITQLPDPIEEEHVRLGPILGVLLIILVLILGGLYLWGASLRETEVTQPVAVILNNEPETERAKADIHILNTVSSSDSVEAIEADLESTNLESFDTELQTIGIEIENAL